MKRFFVILLLLVIACNQNKSEAGKDDSNNNSRDSLISTLMGKWGTDKGEPTWEISKDSLYYFTEKRAYYYLVHDEDLVVLYKEGPFLMTHPHVVRDTLFFKIHDGLTVEMFRIK